MEFVEINVMEEDIIFWFYRTMQHIKYVFPYVPLHLFVRGRPLLKWFNFKPSMDKQLHEL